MQKCYVHTTLPQRLSPALDLIPMPTLLLYDMKHRIFIAIYIYSTEVLVLFTVIVIVCAGVKSTNVCPHNGTYDLCDFLENRFCGHSTFALQSIE